MLPRPYLLFYISAGISVVSGILRLWPPAQPLKAVSSFLFGLSFYLLGYYQQHPERTGTTKARILQIVPMLVAVLLMLWLHSRK